MGSFRPCYLVSWWRGAHLAVVAAVVAAVVVAMAAVAMVMVAVVAVVVVEVLHPGPSH